MPLGTTGVVVGFTADRVRVKFQVPLAPGKQDTWNINPTQLRKGKAPATMTQVFLPVTSGGVRVLVDQGSGKWLVDNSILHAESYGLNYRRSKRTEDKVTGRYAPWASIVEGTQQAPPDAAWLLTEIPMAQEFPLGARVKLIPGSRFSSQTAAIATLKKAVTQGHGWVKITFDDGHTNSYEYEDLQLCQAAE